MVAVKAIPRKQEVVSAIGLDLTKTKGQNIEAITNFLSQFQIKVDRNGWVSPDYHDHSPTAENDILVMDIRGYSFSLASHGILVRSPNLNSLRMMNLSDFAIQYEVIQDAED